MAATGSNSINNTPAVTCIKIVLMILNIIFFVTGFAILSLGIWVRVSLHVYLEMTGVYDSLTPWVLVAIGCGIVIITVLGCYCTICGNACLLYFYGLLLFVIFIAEFAVAMSAFVFKGKVESGFETTLDQYMKTYDTDDDHKNSVDHLQENLHCCGFNSPSDWKNISWTKELLHNEYPASCYEDPNDFASKVYEEGCFDKVSTFVENNFLMLGGVAIAFSFIQLFGATMACCLGKKINRSKYEQVA